MYRKDVYTRVMRIRTHVNYRVKYTVDIWIRIVVISARDITESGAINRARARPRIMSNIRDDSNARAIFYNLSPEHGVISFLIFYFYTFASRT